MKEDPVSSYKLQIESEYEFIRKCYREREGTCVRARKKVEVEFSARNQEARKTKKRGEGKRVKERSRRECERGKVRGRESKGRSSRERKKGIEGV